MVDDVSPEQAQAAAERDAGPAQRATPERRRSLALGKAITAGLFAATTLAWGLVEPFALRAGFAFGLLFLVVPASLLWARRERRLPGRDMPGSAVATWPTTTAIAFVMVAAVGDGVHINGNDLTGRPEYWIPAALIVAAPLVVSMLRGSPK